MKALSAKQKNIYGIAAFILLINILTAVLLFFNRGEYVAYIDHEDDSVVSYQVIIEDESVVSVSQVIDRDETLEVHLSAVNPGITTALVNIDMTEGTWMMSLELKVDVLGGLHRLHPLDYAYWYLVLADISITLVLLLVILYIDFIDKIKKDLYSHSTIQVGGMAVFLSGMVLLLLFLDAVVFIFRGVRGGTAGSMTGFFEFSFMLFCLCTIPFVFSFGIALIISNIRLITREGFRISNILGIGFSIVLMAGNVICFLPNLIRYNEWNMDPRLVSAGQFSMCVLMSFVLSLILSTMICGLIAAKRIPELNRDYIIVLGCGIRPDGTLYPLLQGRVDKAIWLWKRQLAETGKKAVIVPSGGRGADEIISESEAMKRYLLGKGIPEECILMEDKSGNTTENMRFSKALIDERGEEAEIAFSTTNYHVFRSGMLSREAGMNAQGIGSRTGWFFWPNAFVREFAGLVYNARKRMLIFFGCLTVLSYVVGMFLSI